MSFFEKLINITKAIPVSPKGIERCRGEAESGDVKAQYALGGFYERGQGVPQDYCESAKWYRRAAAQGHVGAQLYLGIYLAQGNGVEQDFVEAYKWVELAKRGNALDKIAALETQNRLIKFMTAEQIAEGQRLSREFVPS